MDFLSFQDLALDIYSYFDRKPPTGARIKLWSRRVKDIPIAVIPAIKNYMFELDNMPRNFPKACKAAWHIYLNTNQNNRTLYNDECSFCKGSGLLHAEKIQEGHLTHRPVAGCGHCNNWKNYFADPKFRRTYQEYRMQGYNVFDNNKYNQFLEV